MAYSSFKPSGTDPFPRVYHSASNNDGEIFIFGGSDSPNSNQVKAELCVLNTSGLKSYVTPKTTGVVPSPKRFHSSILADKKLVIFGGEDDKCEASDEVIVLTTRTLAWAKPRIIGEKPLPRSRHRYLKIIFFFSILIFSQKQVLFHSKINL